MPLSRRHAILVHRALKLSVQNDSALSRIPVPRAQAGAFLTELLKRQLPSLFSESDSPDELDNTTVEGRDAITKRHAETDEKILALNVILVYKKVVQGLIYSPPDCDKYLALDAKPQVSVALPPTLARLWQRHQGLAQCLRESVLDV